jgi:hypothetical protein
MSDQPPEQTAPEPAPPQPADRRWGELVVTLVTLALFAFCVIAGAFGLTVPERPAALVDYGVVLVMGYWLGTSNGARSLRQALLERIK